MSKCGYSFFFRGGWRVSSKLPSRGKGSSSNLATFVHPNIRECVLIELSSDETYISVVLCRGGLRERS
jgi:hypothetical protein